QDHDHRNNDAEDLERLVVLELPRQRGRNTLTRGELFGSGALRCRAVADGGSPGGCCSGGRRTDRTRRRAITLVRTFFTVEHHAPQNQPPDDRADAERRDDDPGPERAHLVRVLSDSFGPTEIQTARNITSSHCDRNERDQCGHLGGPGRPNHPSHRSSCVLLGNAHPGDTGAQRSCVLMVPLTAYADNRTGKSLAEKPPIPSTG